MLFIISPSQVVQCPSSWERSLPLSLVMGPTRQATTQRTASSHWVCTHDGAHTYTHTYVWRTHTHAHTYVHTYDEHTHKRMHTHAHINTLIYMYVLTHARTTQQTHAHTCIYTNFLLFCWPTLPNNQTNKCALQFTVLCIGNITLPKTVKVIVA